MRDVRTLEKGLDDVGADLETLDVRLQSVQGQAEETIKIGGVAVPNLLAVLGLLVERVEHNDTLIDELKDALGLSLNHIEQEQRNYKNQQMKRWIDMGPLV